MSVDYIRLARGGVGQLKIGNAMEDFQELGTGLALVGSCQM